MSRCWCQMVVYEYHDFGNIIPKIKKSPISANYLHTNQEETWRHDILSTCLYVLDRIQKGLGNRN